MREVARHDQGRTSIEGEGRHQHPPVADGDQLRDPRRRLALEERHGVGPDRARFEAGVARTWHFVARRPSPRHVLRHGQVGHHLAVLVSHAGGDGLRLVLDVVWLSGLHRPTSSGVGPGLLRRSTQPAHPNLCDDATIGRVTLHPVGVNCLVCRHSGRCSEHGGPVVLDADDRPAVGLPPSRVPARRRSYSRTRARRRRGGRAGERRLVHVMGELEHRDVAVGVPGGEERPAAGAAPDADRASRGRRRGSRPRACA